MVLLAIAGVLAVSSLVGDSITFDELHHFTSGYSYLKTGDFRLAAAISPLPKMWFAWPVLLTDNQWPAADSPAWRTGNVWAVGQAWLFELNDGERLLLIARCMAVILLLGSCLAVYSLGARLFGPRAGLMALTMAVFSPTFLAHGRLVTTDLPVTLAVTLTLLAFARLLERITWLRVLLAAVVLAALSLTKYSWPLVLPALAIMGAAAVVRKQPIPFGLFPWASSVVGSRDLVLSGRGKQIAALIMVAALAAAAVWLGIWTCFGWRYSVFAENASPDARMLVIKGADIPRSMDEAWDIMFTHPEGGPIGGATAGFVGWGRKHRFLPEGYLYGLLGVRRATTGDPGYLIGQYTTTGWRSYFPTAFAI